MCLGRRLDPPDLALRIEPRAGDQSHGAEGEAPFVRLSPPSELDPMTAIVLVSLDQGEARAHPEASSKPAVLCPDRHVCLGPDRRVRVLNVFDVNDRPQ